MKSDLPAKEEFLSLKSLSGYIGDFISYMQMARGMSPNTCKSYERDLILFAGFLMNGNIDQAVKDCFFKVSEVDAALVSLDSGVIKSFVSALTVKGYSPASINRILSGVRGLYTYLYRYGITSSNPGNTHARSMGAFFMAKVYLPPWKWSWLRILPPTMGRSALEPTK